MNFAHWQPHYADHGIATIPCDESKRPLVRNPQKFGRSGSAEITTKFGEAPAFGFYAGPRNGITVLDVDSTDEDVLATALDRHGSSPIIVRTGSGKFHALYRHNGERRSIRAWEGLPIDLLGAGLCIAPPSTVVKGKYEIIEGHLDDIDRLPIMRELEDWLYNRRQIGPRPKLSELKDGDGRNNALFRQLGREAHHVDVFDQLLDRAMTLNEQFGAPMEAAEVTSIANYVWKMTTEGRNRFGQRGAWFAEGEAVSLAKNHQDALVLLTFLKASNGPDSTFLVANGLAEILGWRRQRLAAARSDLAQLGYLKLMRGASQYGPALYRWGTRNTGGKGSVEDRWPNLATVEWGRA
jgi:Bifunctional DNA primase/polymerase, N-terminal/Primase C terminal 1 (PriCT-1)